MLYDVARHAEVEYRGDGFGYLPREATIVYGEEEEDGRGLSLKC